MSPHFTSQGSLLTQLHAAGSLKACTVCCCTRPPPLRAYSELQPCQKACCLPINARQLSEAALFRSHAPTLTTRELFEFAVDPSITAGNQPQALRALWQAASSRSPAERAALEEHDVVGLPVTHD